MEIKPVARFHCPVGGKFGLPRQSGIVDSLKGHIIFEPKYRNPDAIRGLEGSPTSGSSGGSAATGQARRLPYALRGSEAMKGWASLPAAPLSVPIPSGYLPCA